MSGHITGLLCKIGMTFQQGYKSRVGCTASKNPSLMMHIDEDAL